MSWPSLIAPIGLGAYFLLALLFYGIGIARGTLARDPDMAARRDNSWVGRALGDYLMWAIRPFWSLVVRLGLPPGTFTAAGLVLAGGAGVAAAFGHFGWAGWCYLFGGICDLLDGRMARLQDRVSRAGAFLDAVGDRYGEAFLFIGLATFYRESWVLLVVLAALVGSFMVSYARARAEAFGISLVNGLMQRAERVVLLGLALVASPFVALLGVGHFGVPHPLVVIVVGLLAVSANATAIFRIHSAVGRLRGEPARPSRAPLVPHRVAFPRNLVTTALASAIDFGVVTALVAGMSLDAALATFLGAAAGGLSHFALNRLWAFDARVSSISHQFWRYAAVSGSSALLAGAGVSLLQWVFDYRIAWGIVRLLVHLGWSYPLQRAWVFARPRAGAELPQQK